MSTPLEELKREVTASLAQVAGVQRIVDAARAVIAAGRPHGERVAKPIEDGIGGVTMPCLCAKCEAWTALNELLK